jgi:hypothetical protein
MSATIRVNQVGNTPQFDFDQFIGGEIEADKAAADPRRINT